MTWASLLKRAWAAWKLRKVSFELCERCSIPLSAELKEGGAYGDYCVDCMPIIEEANARRREEEQAYFGTWTTILAPGLSALSNQARSQQEADAQEREYQNQIRMQSLLDPQSQLAQQQRLGQSRTELSKQLGNLFGGIWN